MNRMRRCDWRGRGDCSCSADVELLYPRGRFARAERRLVCRRHARMILAFCRAAGLDVPMGRRLATS